MNLWVSTVLIGVAFSLVPAVLWPAVPYLVTAERLGTAYGLMTMLQNIGMCWLNLGAGALNDAYGASPENPGGYNAMLLAVLRPEPVRLRLCVCVEAARNEPEGHGLESIKATGSV